MTGTTSAGGCTTREYMVGALNQLRREPARDRAALRSCWRAPTCRASICPSRYHCLTALCPTTEYLSHNAGSRDSQLGASSLACRMQGGFARHDELVSRRSELPHLGRAGVSLSLQ